MSRAAGAAGRSGDPRKRAALGQAPQTTTGTGRRLVLALVAVLGLAVLVLVVLRPAEDEQDSAAREHAVVACDLTSKAEEATDVATDARLAAAVLLLDQAIISSARAAEGDPAFADLDDAVQAVHTAGHQGDRGPWRDALDTALAACRTSTG